MDTLEDLQKLSNDFDRKWLKAFEGVKVMPSAYLQGNDHVVVVSEEFYERLKKKLS